MYDYDYELIIVIFSGNIEIWCFLSGTIGDLSDGESISGVDSEGLLDPSKKGSKRNMRKTARARTVLSEKQLSILKTCYSANPRPDALMKEQLVEMTALSPRVIRVWFQNKRCKVGPNFVCKNRIYFSWTVSKTLLISSMNREIEFKK